MLFGALESGGTKMVCAVGNEKGYIVSKALEDIDDYIVPASLNDDQGIMGALKLAIDSLT